MKEYYPYIAGFISYLILRFMKSAGLLKRFDKYMWSPFVVSFSTVCLGWVNILYWDSRPYLWLFSLPLRIVTMNVNSFMDLFAPLFALFLFSQGLWIAAILQVIAIKKSKLSYLRAAYFLVWLSILIPLFLINYKFS